MKLVATLTPHVESGLSDESIAALVKFNIELNGLIRKYFDKVEVSDLPNHKVMLYRDEQKQHLIPLEDLFEKLLTETEISQISLSSRTRTAT